MPTDHIRYDLLAQDALRGVVRTVLADAAKNGLIGEHHFKISFDTRTPGVRLPPRLRAQFPQEMTIILQYEFWDLTVSDDAFEVGLSFGGIRERLRVPLAAITGFFDPAVQFGLQFVTITEDEDAAAEQETGAAVPPPIAAKPEAPEKIEKPQKSEKPKKPTGGGEVVRFDRFRKK